MLKNFLIALLGIAMVVQAIPNPIVPTPKKDDDDGYPDRDWPVHVHTEVYGPDDHGSHDNRDWPVAVIDAVFYGPPSHRD